MKELVIISGKGGTGKTSFTAALAVLAGTAVTADCDVDASNLPLLLKPEILEENRFYSGKSAGINAEACSGCGACSKACRFEAVSGSGGAFQVDPVKCEGCGVCVQVCPAGAVEFTDNLCGRWFRSQSSAGAMIHARLDPGAENSGKLVTQVRKAAKAVAAETAAPWLLVDGPPGIGCPVIASVTGCDAAVVVTEPTLSGLHDLERVLKLTRHFQIPAFVIVNKWDLNSQVAGDIEKAAARAGAVAAGRIPYSRLFTEAVRRGETIVEYRPGSKAAESVCGIWAYLKDKLQN